MLIYFGIESHRARNKKEPLSYERLPPGRPAPDILLGSTDGSVRKLSNLKGKAVLLHFWATWCPPCKEELPVLLSLGRDLPLNGSIEIVAVTFDPDWAAVRKFLGGEIPCEIAQDRGKNSIGSYGLSELPETYLIAPDGTLRLRFRGVADWSDRRIRDVVASHMAP